MELIIVKNSEQWNAWAQENGASFLQSWEWGEILIAEGKEVERLTVVEGAETVAQAQVVYQKLPLGMKYAFCPGGPVVNFRFKILDFRFYELLRKYLARKKCIFFRHEYATTLNLKSKIKNLKSIDLTPRATTILDLIKSDDELLSAMREKTRYNIRLSERKGLVVKDEKNFEVFWKLSAETAERDDFKLHGKTHYKAIFASDLSKQLTVYLGETPIAVAIFVGFPAKSGSASGGGDSTFTYLFGASDHEHRKLMAPHLIQWEGIKLAKKLGYKKYDFFGIAPSEQENKKERKQESKIEIRETVPPSSAVEIATSGPEKSDYKYVHSHQYAGVTRFKLGFGGEVAETPGTWDLIISPAKYKVYQLLRRVRRMV